MRRTRTSFGELPSPTAESWTDDGICSLITLYQRVHEAIHIRPTTAASGGAARAPAKLVYLRTEHEAVLGWVRLTFAVTLRCLTDFSPADNVQIRALPRCLSPSTEDRRRLRCSRRNEVDPV